MHVECCGAVDEFVVLLVAIHDNARHHEAALSDVAQLLHRLSVDAGIGHLQRDASHGELLQLSESALSLLLLVGRLNAQQVAQQDESQDGANDTHGVGHGVTHGNVGCVYAGHAKVCLLSGSQSGCVGYGTREDACEGGEGRVGGEMNGHHGQQAQADRDEHEYVERQSSFLK